MVKIHEFSGEYTGHNMSVCFNDKRTYNSFENAINKAMTVKVSSPQQLNSSVSMDIENPASLNGFVFHKSPKHDVCIKHRDHSCTDTVTLTPNICVYWEPEIVGTRWNDGTIHFNSVRTKLSCEFSHEDLQENLKMLGVETS